MARTTRPLTNTEADKAKPRDKVYNLFDGHGLVLRVNPNGSKKWLFNYAQPFTKKRTSISFGSYPVVPIKDARAMREAARELLAKDIDPKLHRDEQARQNKAAMENTLKAVTDQWHQLKQTKVTPDHAHKLYRSLEIHVLPQLGRLPIHAVKAPMVIDVLKPLAGKGHLETVRRVCQRINEVMYYAVNSGLIDSNPLAKISEAFETPKKKHMATIQPSELSTLMATIANASIKRTTRCLIEWQLCQSASKIDQVSASNFDQVS